MKLAVIFPGIGYHIDKPLLYYASRLVRTYDFEVVEVDYGEIDRVDKNHQEKLDHAISQAIKRAESKLSAIDFSQYEKVVFISKSIGTVVAAALSMQLTQNIHHILYTPLAQTFAYPIKKGIAFHGTSDAWVPTDKIKALCQQAGLPLYITDRANHSMETDDILENIEILHKIIKQSKAYLLNQMAVAYQNLA